MQDDDVELDLVAEQRFAESVSPALLGALGALAQEPTILVGLDLGESISQLQPDTIPPAAVSDLLDSLASLTELAGTRTAIFSSRSLDYVKERLRPPAGIALICSHGQEVDDWQGGLHTQVDLDYNLSSLLTSVSRDLALVCARHPGTVIEYRPASVFLAVEDAPPLVASSALAEARTLAAHQVGVRLISGDSWVILSVLPLDMRSALSKVRGYVLPDATLYIRDMSSEVVGPPAMLNDPSFVSVEVGSSDIGHGSSFGIASFEAAIALLDHLRVLR